jgi:hypothetical protein
MAQEMTSLPISCVRDDIRSSARGGIAEGSARVVRATANQVWRVARGNPVSLPLLMTCGVYDPCSSTGCATRQVTTAAT